MALSVTTRELLLVESDSFREFASVCTELLGGLLLGIVLLALIAELLGEGNILGVVKRLIIAVALSTSAYAFQQAITDKAFYVADTAIERVGGENILFESWTKSMGDINRMLNEGRETDMSKNGHGLWGWIFVNLFNVKSIANGGLMAALLLFVNASLFLIKAIYTVVFHMNYAFFTISAFLHIIPQFKASLEGAFKTVIWCAIMPLLVVGILIFLNSEIAQSMHAGEIIGGTLEGTGALIGFTLMLLISPLLAFFFMGATGMAGAAGVVSGIIGNNFMKIASKGWGIGQGPLKDVAQGVARNPMGLVRPMVSASRPLANLAHNTGGELKNSLRRLSKENVPLKRAFAIVDGASHGASQIKDGVVQTAQGMTAKVASVASSPKTKAGMAYFKDRETFKAERSQSLRSRIGKQAPAGSGFKEYVKKSGKLEKLARARQSNSGLVQSSKQSGFKEYSLKSQYNESKSTPAMKQKALQQWRDLAAETNNVAPEFKKYLHPKHKQNTSAAALNRGTHYFKKSPSEQDRIRAREVERLSPTPVRVDKRELKQQRKKLLASHR